MFDISDLKLERFALGELPAAELNAIEARLKNDSILRERLRALEASNAAILGATTPESFATRLRAIERRRAAEASVTNPGRVPARSFGVWKPLVGSLALVLPLLAILALPTRITGPESVSETAPATGPALSGGTEGLGKNAQEVPPYSSSETSSEKY